MKQRRRPMIYVGTMPCLCNALPRVRARAGHVALLLAGLLTASSAPARATDWGDLGLGGARTRTSTEITGPSFGRSSWQHQLDDQDHVDPGHRTLLASPAVADGFLALATQRNTVQLLRESDGQLLWQAKVGGGFYASPVIWRGWVFVQGMNNQLLALDIADGQVAWRRDLGSGSWASPVIAGDRLFVTTDTPTPRVMRIDPRTGKIVWQAGDASLQQPVAASLAVASGQVVAVEAGGRVHSFDAEDGHHRWSADLASTVNLASPLVAGDRVFIATGGDRARLFALDLATGAVAPSWPLDLALPEHGDGTRLSRVVHISSPAGDGNPLLVNVRADDHVDTDGDGDADRHVLQETLFAIDGAAARVRWTQTNGRREVDDDNLIPTHGFVPSPALLSTGGTGRLAVAASSIGPRVRVVELGEGKERWAMNVSGASRSSPVFANGRLIVATDRGTIHSLLSRSNRPPVAPERSLSPADGSEVDRAPTELAWGSAPDPDADPVRYQIRLDDDGEVLRDWDQELTNLGQTSVRLAPLEPGKAYTFAVRAQDPSGAYSAWSRATTFHTLDTPAVTVDGKPAVSLTEAVAMSLPGQVIQLGAGIFPLPATLRLRPGTTLAGAGPHLTTLRARNLPVGVEPGPGSGLRQLTITGAQVGVEIKAAQGVRLQNVILRDNSDAGVAVATSGSAEIINVTAARNGTGLRLNGATHVRNGLIWANDIGLEALAPALVDSRHNDVVGNRVEDWRNARPGATDLAQPVSFEPRGDGDPDAEGLRLKSAQPTTDKGDPTDDWSEEPAPNGGRINIGAFGNTRFAELSASPGLGNPPVGQPGPGPTTPTEPPPVGRAAGGGSLCALADDQGRPDGAILLVAGVLLLIRRRRR
jgi:outer membrane protein assembly factor BamB